MFKYKISTAAITGLILFFWNQHMCGQMLYISDTLELETFTIEQSRQHTFDVGNKKISADSVYLEQYEGSSLNELLGLLAPLNLKNGGTSGAVSTLSLRGAGGARTLVTWNGIPLNSLTSGDVNLSLLNSSAFNEVILNYTAPSTLYGSSSFGGVLELNNKPGFLPEISAGLSHVYGSFNTESSTAMFKRSGMHFYTQTNAWRYDSKNNFPYFDMYYDKTLNRSFAEHSGHGLISNNSFRIGSANIISASIWYQDNMSHLPPENGTHPNMKRSTQSDQSVRTFLKWNMEHDDLYVTAKVYYIDEHLLYTQKLTPADSSYSIYSDIHPVKTGLDIDARYTFGSALTADFGSTLYHNLARGANYVAVPSETNLALYSAWLLKLKQVNLVASVRKEFHTQYDPPVRFGLGTNYSLVNKRLNFRFNMNQKYRVPTFNDKYWPGSGNPDLRPETGYTLDGGIDFKKQFQNFTLSGDVTLYRNNIRDMIVWIPTEDGQWKPRNQTNVLSKGIESHAAITIRILQHLQVTGSTSFDLNNSSDDESALQLIYTPRYRSLSTTTIKYKNLTSLFNFSFLSRRRYDSSGFSLPAFYTSDLALQYKIQIQHINLFITGKINNILNKTEPYVKDFPIPGRNYHMGLKIKYHRKY
ncbi:TonB-dependent receptor plug domain-containing protein [Saccharicrinis sp. FJH54]|uniref:TonB-dependent receptor plug domain-containing protein n=1 Tax=Saccharicrinis sp. FJH54 TaxID=3344665 RepID=UPI0035D44235